MQDANSQNAGAQTMVQAYLEALDARDLSRCVEFFADDAVIDFQSGIYQGKEAIEEWHKIRFEADFKVINVDGIGVQGDKVTVDAVITSKRLRAWKIRKLGGKVDLRIQHGKIKNARFGVRMTNPLEVGSDVQ
jgi:ketosteroid isomerase-like protein